MSNRGRNLNETTFGIPTIPASTFPHFKKPMPPDQRNKLMAMHRAGKINAGIYVAIVLAIYLILLTLLLCRYSRKHRSQIEGRHNYCFCCGGLDDDRPKGPLDWILTLSSCFNPQPSTKSRDHPSHSIEDHQPHPPEAMELIDKVKNRGSSLPRQSTQEETMTNSRPVEV